MRRPGEFTVEGVSCEVGAEIHRKYAQGSRGGLVAEDPESGKSISVTCDEGTTPVTCEGTGGTRIYFAPGQPAQPWKAGPRPFSPPASHCAIWVRSEAPAG